MKKKVKNLEIRKICSWSDSCKDDCQLCHINKFIIKPKTGFTQPIKKH